MTGDGNSYGIQTIGDDSGINSINVQDTIFSKLLTALLPTLQNLSILSTIPMLKIQSSGVGIYVVVKDDEAAVVPPCGIEKKNGE